eukprot:scaffold295927_cov166-Cyclotella_meneghiniana.AAC.1
MEVAGRADGNDGCSRGRQGRRQWLWVSSCTFDGRTCECHADVENRLRRMPCSWDVVEIDDGRMINGGDK